VLAPLVYFFLPDSPERSKFLTEAEKEVITASRAAAGNGTAAHFEWKYLRDVATGECWLGTTAGSGILGVSTLIPDYKIYMTTFLSSSVNIAIFGYVTRFCPLYHGLN
jgi:hypothetical protein